MMTSVPKICAVALLLAAGSADGRIMPRQSSCSCNHGKGYPIASHRLSYGIHTPTSHLMNSFIRDPWFDHHDLWHDPYSLGHRLVPWSLPRQLWGAGIATFFGPMSAKDGGFHGRDVFRLGCHKCQADTMDVADQSKGETELHQQRNDLGCHGQHQEADRRNAQPKEDHARREREQHRRENEQEIERQRLQQERQRLKEEAELNRRHQEERRLQEEKRRMQQRLRDEETEKMRHSEEEQRWRQRQTEEAEAVRIQRNRERSRRVQKEKGSDESRQQEIPRGRPNQAMKTDTRHSHENNNKKQRGQYKTIQVALLNIPGYTPEDVTVTKSGNRLMVQGKHVCDCHEQCTEREFQRSFALPRNVNPASLGATLTKDGQLTVTGNQANTPVQPTDDFVVAVKGDGSFTSRPRNIDSTCGGRRKGFKLKKMNKRTGEIVDDDENLVVENDRTFEDEVDEDGVTMEVED